MKNISILIKPVSDACNINCSYCFYKEQADRRSTHAGRMSHDTREALLTYALQAAEESCTFAFQGGEPTLAGLAFFEDFVKEAERRKRPDTVIQYVIQTNGLLLDEAWLAFLKENNFLVGLSLDGTKGMHDRYRKGYEGQDTFEKVMEILHKLQRAEIAYNVLTVLTGQAAGHIGKIYEFFQKQGIVYQQYIPCLEPPVPERGQQTYSLRPEAYAQAIKRLFDLWFLDYEKGDYVYIRQFENWAGAVKGIRPEACALSGCCSMQNVVEADGSIYACDFYATDAYRCDNVHDRVGAEEGIHAEADAAFFLSESERIRESSRQECLACSFWQVCRGGCRRDYTETKPGEWRNYYCASYKEIFAYIWTRLVWVSEH